MKTIKFKIHIISHEIFQFSLVTYLILLLTEALQQGFVSYFFDLNILLGIVFVSGIIMLLTYKKEFDRSTNRKKITKKDIFWSVCFALIGSFIVFYKTFYLGSISLLVACIAGVIIIIFALLFKE